MKHRFLALLLAALLVLPMLALADAPVGAWTNGESIYDFHENGTAECYDKTGALTELLAWAQGEDGMLTLYGGTEDYALAWQQRDGWLTMTDDLAEVTVWYNATPEQPDAGLEKRADKPLVGVWTQAADDLDAAILALYDDGVYVRTDLLTTGSEAEIGVYRAIGDLLTLYPADRGALYPDPGVYYYAQTGSMPARGDAAWTAVPKLSFVPTEDELTGVWLDEGGAKNDYQGGVLTITPVSGEPSAIGYALCGSQLLLIDQQTGFTLRTTALLDDGALVLTARGTGGKPITTRLTKDGE